MAWDWGQIFDYAAPIVGGLLEGQGSKDAANASSRASQAAIDEQRRQFDTAMALLYPQMATGNQALNELSRLFGYETTPLPSLTNAGGTPTGATPRPTGARPSGAGMANGLGAIGSAFATGSPLAAIPALFANNTSRQDHKDFASSIGNLLRTRGVFGADTATAAGANPGSGTINGIAGPVTIGASQPTGLDVFTASPDYNFRRNEGMRGIENSFAARGGAASGNALRALNEFNSNLASGEFGDFFNRRAALAGIGQTATNQGVSAGNYTSGNIAGLLQNQGNARASGIEGQTNALTGILSGLLSTWKNRQNTMSL